MKLGFYHDVPLIHSDGNYYSTGFTASIWKRYLTVFPELVVTSRVTDLDPEGYNLSSAEGVEFKPVKLYRGPKSLFTSYFQIRKEIQESLRSVDAAIVRLPSVLGWIAYAQAKKLHLPVLVELVGCPWDAYRSLGSIGKAVAPIAFQITRAQVRKARFVIYVTEHFLQQRYPSNGRTVGISNVEVSSKDYNSLTRVKRTLSDAGPIRIGSVGQVNLKYKGFKTALEAVSQLRREGRNVHLELVGGGNQHELIRQASELSISEFLTMRGRLEPNEVNQWMESLDIYIQPSLSEGLPRAAIEAMSVGVPVVLSDAGGHGELVDQSRLFNAGDARDLSNKITAVVDGDMAIDSRRSYKTALRYSSSILNARRTSFLREFRGSVESRVK